MERVLVVGCSGAGKTVFSWRLAERTGLPLLHLDQHFWRAGWVPPEREIWHRQVSEFIAAARWIMDGNYGGCLALRLARADTVFFLELPRWLTLLRVLRRTLTHLGRTRADLAPGCPERFDLGFLKYIWHFNRDHRPRLLAALAQFQGRVVTFRRPAEIEAWLAG